MIYDLRMTAWIIKSDHPDRQIYEQIGFRFKTIEEGWAKGRLEVINNHDLTIEIESLEELNNLVEAVGEVVIGYGEIEIYNDYRE